MKNLGLKIFVTTDLKYKFIKNLALELVCKIKTEVLFIDLYSILKRASKILVCKYLIDREYLQYPFYKKEDNNLENFI